MRSLARLAIPVLGPRSPLVWALVRSTFAVLPLAGGLPLGSMEPWPLGVVILTGLVGLIDVRVRGERILWANLGVTPVAIWAIYAAAAVPAEIILAAVFP